MDFTQFENVASHISMTVHELRFELFQLKYGVSLIPNLFLSTIQLRSRIIEKQ